MRRSTNTKRSFSFAACDAGATATPPTNAVAAIIASNLIDFFNVPPEFPLVTEGIVVEATLSVCTPAATFHALRFGNKLSTQTLTLGGKPYFSLLIFFEIKAARACDTDSLAACEALVIFNSRPLVSVYIRPYTPALASISSIML